MERPVQNGIVAIIALIVPLIAEYVTSTPTSVPGTGFSVLLYEPFDFAYFLLVTAAFIFVNINAPTKNIGSIVIGALVGVGISVLWFGVTFLAVGELHLTLGGKL